MTRFILILLFATATFGVAVVALNQPPASSNKPAAKARSTAHSPTSETSSCSSCPMPSN